MKTVEEIARTIAYWHGTRKLFRDPEGTVHTVASRAGVGTGWGDSADAYAEKYWRDYEAAAEAVQRIIAEELSARSASEAPISAEAVKS